MGDRLASQNKNVQAWIINSSRRFRLRSREGCNQPWPCRSCLRWLSLCCCSLRSCPYALPAAAAPVVAAAPAPAPYVPYAAAPYVGSQFHAQDEFKNLNYGYSNLNSAKHEIGNGYAGANGELQTITYVADGAGFRVEDSRLPVFNPEPLVAPTFNPELPVAPELTPEVAAATAEHLAAHAAEAGDRKKRDADAAVIAGSTAVITPDDGIFYHNAPAVAYGAYGYGLPYGAYHGAYGYAGLHGLGYAGYPYFG